MENIVAIVGVRNSLQTVLDWCLDGHKKREKEPPIWQNVAKAMKEEKEDCDNLCCHRSSYELCQDHFRTTMGQRSMPEEQICKTIQVLHLNVCAGQHVWLLIVLDKSYCDIRLSDREFVRLLRNDTDHVA